MSRNARSIIALFILLSSTAGAAERQRFAQSYWTQDQCLSAADICRQNCKVEFNSCLVRSSGFAAKQECAKASRECIYVTCDSSTCFSITDAENPSEPSGVDLDITLERDNSDDLSGVGKTVRELINP